MDKEIQKTAHEEMKEIFANVNAWLNFGEVKNSALVAVNIALLIGIFELKDQFEPWYFNVIVVTILLSFFLALLSFLPIIQKKVLKSKLFQNAIKVKTTGENLIFYGDITNHYTIKNIDDYVKKLYKEYFDVEIQLVGKLDRDLAEEIVINSWITTYKYFMFRNALVIFYIPVIMLIMTFLCG